MTNAVLHDLLDEGVIAYIDEILLYSKTKAEHIRLVKKVLQRLQQDKLCVSFKKSNFHASYVEYLGYHISAERITMFLDKVKDVGDWAIPRNVKEVLVFLGIANF